MAILTNVPGLRVEIVVNGAPLTEHENEDDVSSDPEVMDKYIEAQVGEIFSVRVAVNEPFPTNRDLGYKLWVDGTLVKSSYMGEATLRQHESITMDGVRTKSSSGWTSWPLQFQKLVIGNPSRSQAFPRLCLPSVAHAGSPKPSRMATSVLKSLGTITVNFEFGHAEPTNVELPAHTFVTRGSIPEEAMKGDSKSCNVM
jgi:hypothetical protein